MKILISGANGLNRICLNDIFRISICLMIGLQLVGCSMNQPVNLSSQQKVETFSDVYEKNRKLWREKNISDYDFVCHRGAEGMGGNFKLKFEVRNNEILPLKDKDTFIFLERYEKINSIEKLFDYIQQAAEKGEKVTVAYNSEFGFPEDISISSGKASNDWELIIIQQFEVVK